MSGKQAGDRKDTCLFLFRRTIKKLLFGSDSRVSTVNELTAETAAWKSLMRIPRMKNLLIALTLSIAFAAGISAHPGSGIVVDRQGRVYFTDTGRGVWKIDKEGNFTDMRSSRFQRTISSYGAYGCM